MPISVKVDFREVNTNVKCIDCSRPLKTNLLIKIPKANRCFRHHVLHSYSPEMIQKKLHLSEEELRLEVYRYKMLIGDV